MSNSISVPFHGNTLFVVDYEGCPFTPMKPIAEGMGVSWQGQHEKLKANITRWGIKEILMPSAGGDQSMTCMPLRKLPGWLMTIYPNKVKAESREAIIKYQNECDDVLWEYWTKGQATHPQYALRDLRSKKALPGGLTLDQQDAIKALVRSRVEALPKERQGGAAITCWSALKTKFGCTYKAIAPELFAEALSLVARLDLLGQPALPAPEPIEPPRYNFPLANWQPGNRIGATAWFTFQEWVRLREQGSSQLAELIYTLGRDGHDVSGPQTEFRGLCHMVESMHMQWESMRYMFDKMEGRGLRIQLQPASA